MMNTSISQPAGSLPGILPAVTPTGRTTAADGDGSFASLMKDLVSSLEAEQAQVGIQTSRLMTGDASNFHEVSMAVARADLSFRFMMEVRDQVVGAYREIMRTQM